MFNRSNEIRFNLIEKRIEKIEQKYMDLAHSIQEVANRITDHLNEHDKEKIKKELEKMKPVIVTTKKGRPKKV